MFCAADKAQMLERRKMASRMNPPDPSLWFLQGN